MNSREGVSPIGGARLYAAAGGDFGEVGDGEAFLARASVAPGCRIKQLAHEGLVRGALIRRER